MGNLREMPTKHFVFQGRDQRYSDNITLLKEGTSPKSSNMLSKVTRSTCTFRDPSRPFRGARDFPSTPTTPTTTSPSNYPVSQHRVPNTQQTYDIEDKMAEHTESTLLSAKTNFISQQVRLLSQPLRPSERWRERNAGVPDSEVRDVMGFGMFELHLNYSFQIPLLSKGLGFARLRLSCGSDDDRCADTCDENSKPSSPPP